MKPWLVGVLIAASAGASGPALGAGETSVGVTAASDYVFRGFSRTRGRPAVQAGVSYRHGSGVVAGLWASSVDLAYVEEATDRRRLELQGFAGYSVSFEPGWSLSALLVRYQYPGGAGSVEVGYTELAVAAYWRELVSVTVAHTDDVFGSGRPALFAELSGRYPVAWSFDLAAGVGRGELDVAGDFDYTYGHLGVGRALGRLELELGYYFSDSQEVPRWGEVADGSWVLAASWRWP